MRWERVSGVVALVSCLVLCQERVAEAQPKPSGPARSSTQFTLHREAPGGADADQARARARGGDCVGALVQFDAALRGTDDPLLRRDRGLCHEKLGHPFPAIEDFRAYLTASPDAPDADQIRERLSVLEGQGGGVGASKGENTTEPAASGQASASVSIGGGTSTSSSSSGKRGSRGGDDGQHSYDYYVQQEKLTEAAERSPLRYGSGVVLGPTLHMPRFFVGDQASSKLGYGIALALRYSTGPTVSVISELGYAGVGTSGEVTSQSGPLLMGGVELRLPVSKFAGDQILLRGGLGFERYVVTGTRAVNNNLLGRFAVGFRHVFGPSLAFELLVDGGPAYVIPESGSSRLNALFGGSFALVVGF